VALRAAPICAALGDTKQVDQIDLF